MGVVLMGLNDLHTLSRVSYILYLLFGGYGLVVSLNVNYARGCCLVIPGYLCHERGLREMNEYGLSSFG